MGNLRTGFVTETTDGKLRRDTDIAWERRPWLLKVSDPQSFGFGRWERKEQGLVCSLLFDKTIAEQTIEIAFPVFERANYWEPLLLLAK